MYFLIACTLTTYIKTSEDSYTNTKIALAYVPNTHVAGEVVEHYSLKLLKTYL
jgi:hypothetical protein